MASQRPPRKRLQPAEALRAGEKLLESPATRTPRRTSRALPLTTSTTVLTQDAPGSTRCELLVLPSRGDGMHRYRLAGTLSFSNILKLHLTLPQLAGVTGFDLCPDDRGADLSLETS